MNTGLMTLVFQIAADVSKHAEEEEGKEGLCMPK